MEKVGVVPAAVMWLLDPDLSVHVANAPADGWTPVPAGSLASNHSTHPVICKGLKGSAVDGGILTNGCVVGNAEVVDPAKEMAWGPNVTFEGP